MIQERGATALATYGHDDLSRRTTVTRGNGTTTSYGYDSQSALQSLAHNLAGSGQDVTFSYTRNQAQEIKTLAWSNDLYGWMATQGTRAFTANGLNQYAAVASVPYSYDGNGNLTGDGVWSYSYDADNRLRTATASNVTATLAWDGVGRLRQTTTGGTATQLLYAGTQLVAEYDGAGALLRRYVHGPGSDEPLVKYEGTGTANKTWYYADHLGSVIATVDAAGGVTPYAYGPFGESGTTAPPRFGYTGQQYLAPLGLYHYKARFYAPAIGRFLQPDPIGYAGGINLYAYVGNNPINRIDPRGRSASNAYLFTSLADSGQSMIDGTSQRIPGYQMLDPLHLVAVAVWNGINAMATAVTDIISWAVGGNPDDSAGGPDKPARVPENWREEPTRGEGGRQWVNPENEGDRIRVMPGDPASPNPNQRGPYVRDVRDGNQWLDINGNRIEGKTGRNSPDTHIPVGDYVFRPRRPGGG